MNEGVELMDESLIVRKTGSSYDYVQVLVGSELRSDLRIAEVGLDPRAMLVCMRL